MDTGLAGPRVTPLPPTIEFDMEEISQYITRVLQVLDKQDAYGILAGMNQPGGPTIATFIFGIPGYDKQEIVLPPTPYHIPIMIHNDRVLSTNDLDTPWALEPVVEIAQLTLEGCSVGIERSITRAGSFGGFLKSTSSPSMHYGITAAHCVSGALTGMPVCSPSTIEVTARLERLVRYTNICPLSNRMGFNSGKEREVLGLLQRFRFHDCSAGVHVLNPKNQFQPQTGVLSGGNIGVIVGSHFGSHSDLLHDYDQALRRSSLPVFSATVSWLTRIDYAIFTCNTHRYGENSYQEERISEIGYLYPGAKVEKVGRTTGATRGKVNAVMLQHWDNGAATHEIAIIGPPGEMFGMSGDSGGCVLTDQEGKNQASGLLIGKVLLANIALVTPLHLILQMAGDYEWA